MDDRGQIMDGQNTNNKKKNLKEIVLYLIFGVATTLVNWIVYLLFNNLIFNRFFSENTAMTAANAVAWFLAVLFAFVTNKLIVFKSKEKTARILIPELLSFYASRGLTGLLEIFVPTLLVNAGITFTLLGDEGIFPNALRDSGFIYTTLSDRGLVPKMIVAVVVIILNYVFSKLIVFRKKKKQ
ncbi:MAG: GtrA family protein [Eubacteriales bacterium]|nr:GtrA family protein [Eubacteriales bacterium]